MKLTAIQIKILKSLERDAEMCYGYAYLSNETNTDKSVLQKEIKTLREMNFVEYVRGLMTEDGEVAGSGFCRNWKMNDKIDEAIRNSIDKKVHASYIFRLLGDCPFCEGMIDFLAVPENTDGDFILNSLSTKENIDLPVKCPHCGEEVILDMAEF